MRAGYEYIAMNDYGQMVVRLFDDRSEFVAFLTAKGMRQIGEASGRLNASLVGQPIFDKAVGPMSGNHNSVRYETPEVWERLSRMKPKKIAPKNATYMLRTCSADMTSHAGFVWPDGGWVYATDWSDKPECGHGLYGFLAGKGDGKLASWDEGAK